MASTTSYASLITRAVKDSDDPTLIYDISDKVKGGGPDGATELANVIRDRLVSSESHVRVRLLDIMDTLVIEGGTDFHKALNQTGFFVTLADIHDKALEAALPEHLVKWRSEMGTTYDAVFEQAFSQRTSSGTQGNQNNARSTTLTRRGIGGINQYKVKPVSPLYPFLTIAYFRALRVLEAARSLHLFHMQSIHIARQALHLVILLNDSVDKIQGPTQEQEDERIDLEDELMDLEDAIPKWAETSFESKEDYLSLIEEIKQQYEQFFKARFYFSNARNTENDGMYKKLLAHDQKTFKFKQWQLGLLGDDDDGRSTGFIESVHTSPAISQRGVPGVEDPAVPLSQVNLQLDAAASTAEPSTVLEQPVASTSAMGAEQGDDIAAARRFRKEQEDDPSADQSYTCPVPGCGRKFEKQHLLKHHIREHDDRPYRCPMRDCDRRFATPTEQRVHEALHRIKALGIVPNMPAFAPPIANNPAPPAPVPETVTAEETVADEVKSDGKPEDSDPNAVPDDPVLDDPNLPTSNPQEQEDRDLAQAIEASIQDQVDPTEEAEEASKPTEGEPSTSNQPGAE